MRKLEDGSQKMVDSEHGLVVRGRGTVAKFCVKIVYGLGITTGKSIISYTSFVRKLRALGIKLLDFSQFIPWLLRILSTCFMGLRPVVVGQLYTVSTAPIISCHDIKERKK